MADKKDTDGGRQAAQDGGQAERNAASVASQGTHSSGDVRPSSPRPMPVASGAGPGDNASYDVDAEHYMGGHGPLKEGDRPAFGASAVAEGTAEEREKLMARSRGVAEDELDALAENTVWVVSNRADDRVVLWERDMKHPGGEIVIGGSSPVRAYKTPAVEERIFRGEIAETAEPLQYHEDADGNQIPNRKYPPEPGPDPAIVVAAQPGRPTPLGRRLDPELWGEDYRKAHARKLRGMPSQMPVPQGAIVPTVGDVERRSR